MEEGKGKGLVVIIGIGCDIVETARIEKALKSSHFVERVYTKTEIDYCQARQSQQTMSFAARFAAKEAVLKALGTGLRGGRLLDIEISNDELGKPLLRLTGFFQKLAEDKGCKRMHVSLSHTKELAFAQVVLEGED